LSVGSTREILFAGRVLRCIVGLGCRTSVLDLASLVFLPSIRSAALSPLASDIPAATSMTAR
jgi:hypothetical protein